MMSLVFTTVAISISFLGASAEIPNGQQQLHAMYTQPNYPKYCSIPSEMENRSIPEINSTEVKTQLLQVSAIIRHGARTPYRPHSCWENYGTASHGGKWDCSLTALMSPTRQPPSSSSESGSGSDGETQGKGMFLFEKVYDALQPPVGNYLNGTCLLGQLIEQGYSMEVTNGRHLRNAYVAGGVSNARHNMQIFDSYEYESRPYKDSTYFRGDDEQRTLMSGQILVDSLFDVQADTIVKFHTADRPRDVLTPNGNICPRLDELKEEAHASQEFKELNTSLDAKEIYSYLLNDVKSTLDDPGDVVDCMMTSYCTDRPMPEAISNFVAEEDDSWLSRFYNFFTKIYTFHYRYNDSAHAKLGMGPLWAEIKTPLEQSKRCHTLEDMKDWNIPRLVLFSGHDTTIMPLLASLGDDLWDWKWAPYASMLIIESHAIVQRPEAKFPSDHAFRLIYNGEVITQRMEGCDSELCDLDVLLNYIEPFAIRDRNCSSTFPTDAVALEPILDKLAKVATTEVNASYTIGVALLCCVLSSIVTFTCVTGRLPLFGSQCCREKYNGLSPASGKQTDITEIQVKLTKEENELI